MYKYPLLTVYVYVSPIYDIGEKIGEYIGSDLKVHKGYSTHLINYHILIFNTRRKKSH